MRMRFLGRFVRSIPCFLRFLWRFFGFHKLFGKRHRTKITPRRVELAANLAAFCGMLVIPVSGGGWKEILAGVLMWLAVFVPTDPLVLLREWYSPRARRWAAAAAVVMLLNLYQLGPWQVRSILSVIVCTALMLAGHRNAQDMMRYAIRQSPAVDKALANLCNSAESDAVRAWEDYGCRETRALLHQAVGITCPENVLHGPHRATYILAFLHGSSYLDKEVQKWKKAAKQAEERTESAKKRLSELDTLKEDAAEAWAQVEQLRTEQRIMSGNLSRIKEENKRLSALLEQAGAEIDALTPAPPPELERDERDRQIREFVTGGHSQAEAARVFGLSKSTISKIVNGGK